MRDTRPYPGKVETGWGIYIIADVERGLRSEATLKRVVVERSRDGGQNQCGCQGASIPCRAKSEGLAPPGPLPETL